MTANYVAALVACAASVSAIAPAEAQQTWSGPYFGANVGAVWDKARNTDNTPYASGATAGTVTDLTGKGAFGGAQMGYNWQFGKIVTGLEAELGYLGTTHSTPLTGSTAGSQVGVKGGVYGDLTGKLGFAVSPALMLYAKGGIAFTNARDNFSTVSGSYSSTTHTGTHSGLTYGLGAELMLSRGWSTKLEYQHFNFGSRDYTVYNAAAVPSGFSQRLSNDSLKIGLNYRF
jgi:outer membrane immunogenic protein